MGIDCAAATVGFEFHSGGSHPVFDGFVVCEEFKDILLDTWNKVSFILETEYKSNFNFDVPGDSRNFRIEFHITVLNCIYFPHHHIQTSGFLIINIDKFTLFSWILRSKPFEFKEHLFLSTIGSIHRQMLPSSNRCPYTVPVKIVKS